VAVESDGSLHVDNADERDQPVDSILGRVDRSIVARFRCASTLRRVDHEQQVRETWAALPRGDFDTVEAQFASDAKWRAVEVGEWNCDERTQILRVMRENRARRVLEGDVEEVFDVGERVVVAFRPAHDDPDGVGWPLDDGIRYVVLSLSGGLVTEMKGCLNRQGALDYAESCGGSEP